MKPVNPNAAPVPAATFLALDSYSIVIQNYFLEFIRGLRPELLSRLIAFAAIGITCLGTSLTNGVERNWLVGIPILAAILSAAFHSVSLPFMLYLIPASRKQRERYIQRMLTVKVLIPMFFALLCDIVAWCLSPHASSFYAIFLQLLSVAAITYLCGMLQDSSLTQEFVLVPLLLSYAGGGVMFLICTDTICLLEFQVILTVMSALLLPTLFLVRRHWKQIKRGNKCRL